MTDILLAIVLLVVAFAVGVVIGHAEGRQAGWSECQAWREMADDTEPTVTWNSTGEAVVKVDCE